MQPGAGGRGSGRGAKRRARGRGRAVHRPQRWISARRLPSLGPIPVGMCVRGVRGPSRAVTRRFPRSPATWGSGEGPQPRRVHGRIRACRPIGIGPYSFAALMAASMILLWIQ